MTDWQPISTAPDPEDESFLITNGKIVSIACRLELQEDENGGWIVHEYPDSYNMFVIEPTHWMPLPEPPKQEGEQ